MAEKVTEGFDVLIALARKFVETQKGAWEHTAWLGFLSDVQKRGYELTDDMMNYIGSVLEAMKKVYISTAATKGMADVMADMADLTVDFVKKTRGVWDQSGWETYLKDLQKKGFDLTDEARTYLGEVLEATRKVYTVMPPLASGAKPPKKEEKLPEQKPAEMVEIKKAEETKATKTTKAVPRKKKKAK